MKAWLITLAILHGGDEAATVYGLQHGLRERNRLLPQNPMWSIVAKSAYAGTSMWLLSRLAKEHPKLAKRMAIGFVAAEGFAVGWNVRQIQRHR